MAPTRSTLRDVRRRNRSALLTTLFFNAPLSRQELSHLTGLSVATVGNVTGALIEERLVVEAGLVDSGVCAAVMTHGRSYPSATSSAGEWGHTTIPNGGRQCRCGARGCLEG